MKNLIFLNFLFLFGRQACGSGMTLLLFIIIFLSLYFIDTSFLMYAERANKQRNNILAQVYAKTSLH